MKNIRKVLAVTSIVSALTLGFSPAHAATLPQDTDVKASPASASSMSPTFFHWLCKSGICD
ncbi:hypothetical protein GCM10023352_17350 [Rothia endophytica]|uniref:Uncharacterized protein n=1 Tax=Rothia endophytica TaxID=1324766 RepID=A0ABP9BNG7_9MICC